jgi:WD40 repeat protein
LNYFLLAGLVGFQQLFLQSQDNFVFAWLCFIIFYLVFPLGTVFLLARDRFLNLPGYSYTQQLNFLFFRKPVLSNVGETPPPTFIVQYRTRAIGLVVTIILLLNTISILSSGLKTCNWLDTALSSSGCIKEWDPGLSFTTSLGISSDANTLAVGSIKGKLHLVDAKTGNVMRELTGIGSDDHADNLVFSPDNRLLIASTTYGSILAWQVNDGRLVQSLNTPQIAKNSDRGFAAFSTDGTLLATGTASSDVKIWKVVDFTLLKELPTSGWVASFSPDSKQLATGDSKTGNLTLWRISDGSKQVSFTGDKYPVSHMAFSLDGTTIAAASSSQVQLWQIANSQNPKVLTTFSDSRTTVTSLSFSVDNKFLFASQYDLESHLDSDAIFAWKVADGSAVSPGLVTSGAVGAFSRNGVMATSSTHDKLRLWKLNIAN